MNIIIAVSSYYPSVNGVQYVTQYQSEGLVALGHNVTVLTSCHGVNAPAEEVCNGVSIKRFDVWTDRMCHHGDVNTYQNFLKVVTQNNDILMLVCPESWATDCALPVLDKLSCAKALMVHGIHDFRLSRICDRSPYSLIKKAVGDVRWRPYYWSNWGKFRRFDAVVQLDKNDFGYHCFKEHGIESHVIHNAVDDEFHTMAEVKKKRIVNVGTYHRRKNQALCLEAFYRSSLLDYELVLVGPTENAYYQQLNKFRSSLERRFGHREVKLLTNVPRPETVQIVKESQIYLLSSVTEMQPVSLLEAMAAGAAFVSTNVGVNRFLPGGLIRESAEEMADALEYLSEDNRWRVYGRLGQEYAQKHCRKDAQVNKLETIFERAIRSHESR